METESPTPPTSDDVLNAAAESAAVCEWIAAALAGDDVSDFAESFPEVRAAMDLRAVHDEQCALAAGYAAELHEIRAELDRHGAPPDQRCQVRIRAWAHAIRKAAEATDERIRAASDAARDDTHRAITGTVMAAAAGEMLDAATADLPWVKAIVALRAGHAPAAQLHLDGHVCTTRRRLPDERESKTVHFKVGGHEGYMTVGLYPDGTRGEIFVKMAKTGSAMGGLLDCFGIAVSLALQHGAPLAVLADKFIGTAFQPAGHTGREDIPQATSIMDLLFRWLKKSYLPPDEASV